MSFVLVYIIQNVHIVMISICRIRHLRTKAVLMLRLWLLLLWCYYCQYLIFNLYYGYRSHSKCDIVIRFKIIYKLQYKWKEFWSDNHLLWHKGEKNLTSVVIVTRHPHWKNVFTNTRLFILGKDHISITKLTIWEYSCHYYIDYKCHI